MHAGEGVLPSGSYPGAEHKVNKPVISVLKLSEFSSENAGVTPLCLRKKGSVGALCKQNMALLSYMTSIFTFCLHSLFPRRHNSRNLWEEQQSLHVEESYHNCAQHHRRETVDRSGGTQNLRCKICPQSAVRNLKNRAFSAIFETLYPSNSRVVTGNISQQSLSHYCN